MAAKAETSADARPRRELPTPEPGAAEPHPRGGRAREAAAELAAYAGLCVCGNLRMAARAVTALYDDALRPCGIEANQMQILWALHAAGTVSASELARVVAMDQSTVSRNVALLVRKGLVRASRGKADRRARAIALSPAGRAALLRALPRWKRAQASLQRSAAAAGDVVALGREARQLVRLLQLERGNAAAPVASDE